MRRRATVASWTFLLALCSNCLPSLQPAAALILDGPLNASDSSSNFTVVNGQIYTPGIAIVDAPQPYTPLGGDILQVAIDISGDGRLPQADWDTATPGENDAFALYELNVFLTSYAANVNLTIANGTNVTGLGGKILAQEKGSTVKHTDWVWPDCMVGDGRSAAQGSGDAQNTYNISIHQLFHYNSSDTLYYTVFDLPIQTTNAIAQDLSKPVAIPHGSSNLVAQRPSCQSLSNPLLQPADGNDGTTLFAGVGWFGVTAGGPVLAPGSGGYANGSDPNPPDGIGGGTSWGGGVLGAAGRMGVGSLGVWCGWLLVLLGVAVVL